MENCRRIKAEWVKAARAGVDPVSVCGHHCDFCFLGQWCGGCRSGYNCCSFATISPDGICPQVKCATKKGWKAVGFAQNWTVVQRDITAIRTSMLPRRRRCLSESTVRRLTQKHCAALWKRGRIIQRALTRRAAWRRRCACWSNTVKGEVRASPPTLQSRPCGRASSPQGEPLIRKNVRCQASP